MHTYGRDIKWNPHVHALICEGYFDKYNRFHKYGYFPYEKLRKTFMFELHRAMKEYFKPKITKADFSKFCKLCKFLEKIFIMPSQTNKSTRIKNEVNKQTLTYTRQ